MPDKRLLETGVDFRLLETGVDFRLLETPPVPTDPSPDTARLVQQMAPLLAQ